MVEYLPRRLSIAGLRVLVRDVSGLGGWDDLAERLGPFSHEWTGYPNLVVSSHRAVAAEEFAAAIDVVETQVSSFRGDTEDAARNRQKYLVLMRSGAVLVVVPDPDPLAVVGAVHAGLSALLPRNGGLVLHGASSGLNQEAFVFPGPSGTGKTTAAEAIPGAARVADDRCAIMKQAGRWLVHSLPTWPGRYRPQRAMALPVAAIVFVRKNAALHVRPVRGVEAVTRLLRATIQLPGSAAPASELLDLAVRISHECVCLELSYQIGDDFWPALKRAQVRFTAGQVGEHDD